MNRVIKFRAWDNMTKEMIFPNDRHEPYQTALGIMIKHYGNLMQFTGLHDKNGIEIYEGDIIRSKHWNPTDYKVIFNEGEFCFISLKDVESPYTNSIHYAMDFEVIGNIYENPELLK